MALKVDYKGTADELLKNDAGVKEFKTKTGNTIGKDVDSKINNVKDLVPIIEQLQKIVYLQGLEIERLKGNDGL